MQGGEVRGGTLRESGRDIRLDIHRPANKKSHDLAV